MEGSDASIVEYMEGSEMSAFPFKSILDAKLLEQARISPGTKSLLIPFI